MRKHGTMYKCPGCHKWDKRVTTIWLGIEQSTAVKDVFMFCPECAEELAKWFELRREGRE